MHSCLLFLPSHGNRDPKNVYSDVQSCLVTFWNKKQLSTPAPVTHAGTAGGALRPVWARARGQSCLPPSTELVHKCPLPSSYNQNLFKSLTLTNGEAQWFSTVATHYITCRHLKKIQFI